jgi:hypothetical protein
MNVNTGELRALTEQVERLTVLVRDHQRILIRTISAMLPEDGPRHSPATFRPQRGNLSQAHVARHLRAVEDMR